MRRPSSRRLHYAGVMSEPTANDPTPAAAPTTANGDEPAKTPGPLSLRILALIAVLFTCWAARDLLVPIMLAMFLALIANPLVTRLRKLWIPRWLGALVVVFGGVAMTIFLASLLVAPAADWVRQAPTELKQLAPKLRAITVQVEQANKAAASIAKAAGAAPAPAAVSEDKPHAPDLWVVIAKAPQLLASLGAVVLLSYFFLVYGAGLQRQAIAVLPQREQKHLTTDILRTIEADVSGYVLTITLINITLGLLLTVALY